MWEVIAIKSIWVFSFLWMLYSVYSLGSRECLTTVLTTKETPQSESMSSDKPIVRWMLEVTNRAGEFMAKEQVEKDNSLYQNHLNLLIYFLEL